MHRLFFCVPVLKIRLQPKGRKKRPFYRIVVAESSCPVQGRFLEIVGHYNPLVTPKEVVLQKERILYYLQNGAQPSETVARIGVKNGIPEFEKFFSARVMKPSNAELEAKKKKEEEARAKIEAEKLAEKMEAERLEAEAKAKAEAEAIAQKEVPAEEGSSPE